MAGALPLDCWHAITLFLKPTDAYSSIGLGKEVCFLLKKGREQEYAFYQHVYALRKGLQTWVQLCETAQMLDKIKVEAAIWEQGEEWSRMTMILTHRPEGSQVNLRTQLSRAQCVKTLVDYMEASYYKRRDISAVPYSYFMLNTQFKGSHCPPDIHFPDLGQSARAICQCLRWAFHYKSGISWDEPS